MSDTDRRGGVIIYWRPWCLYGIRLKRRLGPLGERATWLNIWQDPDAAAFVRSVNAGDEVVPTVVIDNVPHTNSPPTLVAEHLQMSQ